MKEMRHKNGGHVVPMSDADAYEMYALGEFSFVHKADEVEYENLKRKEAKREQANR